MPVSDRNIVKVLVADDSDIMREAIRKLLEGESSIEIVGEAPSFSDAMELAADRKPDILLLDLHMPQKREAQPLQVKSQLSCVPHTVAISFANDGEAKSLAASYGAVALLDKMSLYEQLVPMLTHLGGANCGSPAQVPSGLFTLELQEPPRDSSQLSE